MPSAAALPIYRAPRCRVELKNDAESGFMLCYVTLMRCHAMLCYDALCYAALCYAMLRYAMLCYDMLCYVLLRYVAPCRAMPRLRRAALAPCRACAVPRTALSSQRAQARSGELTPADFTTLYRQRLRWLIGWDQVSPPLQGEARRPCPRRRRHRG